MNGAEWKQTRDLVTPLFNRAELMDIEYFKKYVKRLFVLSPIDGSTVDVQPLLQKLVLDSLIKFIFGESIDSLRDTTTESQNFLRAFNAALAGAGKRLNTGGAFSFIYAFDKSWEEIYSKVHAFIGERIEQYYEKSAEKDPALERSRRCYILIDGMAKGIADPVQLRFQLLNTFFPARNTSAILISNALFFLARNPQCWKDLRRGPSKFKVN